MFFGMLIILNQTQITTLNAFEIHLLYLKWMESVLDATFLHKSFT